MNKHKVLFVANVAKEHIRKFHIPTIKRLIADGWQVDVACKGDSEIPEASHFYKMCWERSPFTLKTIKGIKELKHLIAENEYDIVYCHTPVGGLVARFAARSFRKNGLKVVYAAHGLHFFKGAPLINWLIYYPMEKLMAHYTDMFITINSEDFNIASRRFNKKMSVKKINGIGVNFGRLNIENRQLIRKQYREALNIPENAIVMIYVAELIKNKNQKMLLDALNILNNRGHEFYLVLPGPDHQNGEYQRLSDQMNLSKYVRFLGWRSDIGELLTASDICVASSIREGFGLNLVEAQYCHLPVVASSNRGHGSIIEDGKNGFLVDIDDAKAMADKIELLVSDKTLYDSFSNINVGSYACDKIAEEIEGYLNEILKK